MPIHDVLRQRVQPLTALMTSNRIFLYCVFSTFAVAATIANACRAHSNFYSVSIYLSKSSRSVLILANFGFLCSLLFGRVLQKVFFGALQPREVERLYDQTWMFVTESLLAFTIFRDEFDVPFLLMFGFLLFVKCFHWLMADRVESMDQTTYPGPPTLFHVRINSLFFVLWAIDSLMFAFAVESTLTNGVGGMVLFASEYAILLASALNAILRYVLSLLDLRRARTRGGENAPPWENKSMYIFYIELLTDFLKLATYMTFFMIILTFYGLPLNIIRDVFVTARSFITRLRALIRYHNATRDMDRRYPDATEAELAEMSDHTCIICREEMQARQATTDPAGQAPPANGEQQQPTDGPNMTPKKLPCGHIFHFQCLRSWLERQQSCPTCRRTVLETNPPQTPNQAPGQARGAARPRPGAAPAPGGGQQGAANPLGWVGRVFGLPQPPAFPGQFGNAAPGAGQQQPPPPQPAQPQPHAGWGPAHVPGHAHPPPPPPHYWGQPMPGWQPGHPPPPHMFRPPPPPPGAFYPPAAAPGQAWNPWGNPWAFAQPPPPQPRPDGPPPSSQTQPAAAPVVDPAEAPTPTPTTTMNGAAPATEPGSSTSSPAANADTDDRPEDPRAAAALAALRRRKSGTVTDTESETSARSTRVPIPVTDTADRAHSSAHPSTSSGTASTLPGPSTPSTSASSSAPAPPPTTANPAHPHPPLPSLIPMYDPAAVQPYWSSPYSSYYPPSVFPPPAFGFSHPSSSPFAQPSRRAEKQPESSSSRRAQLELPAALTEAQLANLESLTREAIEERLNVLEGVATAVNRCIEQLTAVKSALPPRATVAEGKGKAKEAAATAPLREDGSATSAPLADAEMDVSVSPVGPVESSS